MIDAYDSVLAVQLHGGPFGGGDEYKMELSRQLQLGQEEYWWSVHGSHKGSAIQFDFNMMNRSELEDMRAAIDLILEIPITKQGDN